MYYHGLPWQRLPRERGRRLEKRERERREETVKADQSKDSYQNYMTTQGGQKRKDILHVRHKQEEPTDYP